MPPVTVRGGPEDSERRNSAALSFSSTGTEALDDPATDPALVRRMLNDIARSNRWLGGAHAMRIGLAGLIDARDCHRSLTLFDIGTGAGDLPIDARAWGAERDVTIVPLALERIPAAASMAHNLAIPTLLGCASALPIRSRSVDIVLMSQVLHHLDPDSAVQLLIECDRVARRGVIVADLHRSWYAGPAFRIAGALLQMHQVTIDDGVTSVRRGFRTDDLRALCARAGVRGSVVRRSFGSRVIAWWRTGATRQ